MYPKQLIKIWGLFLILIVSSFRPDFTVSAQQKNVVSGYIPQNGFVPNKTTAIKIAVAVWLPIYGNKIYAEQPFNAVLKDEIWTVTGSLPKNAIGGVALIMIRKKDGKILRVIHGK